MASLGLAGLAAASTGSITGPTGPDSINKVKIVNHNETTTRNTNRVDLDNFNLQGSSTGNASAHENTSVTGGVGSGDASNSSTTSTSLTIHNSASVLAGGSGGGSDNATISGPTGPDSINKVTILNNNEVKTTNNNTVDVSNVNLQFAKSGNATASDNTTVGGVSSGDASNTSNTSTTLNITN